VAADRLSASVVIPVKNGARHLAEVLAAVLSQEDGLDVLVIDSGSTDGSLEIARSVGVRLLEIAPEEFGHGRTRNVGAEHTEGELICFLTQDATPLPGWLDAYREAFGAFERVGAAYGPHRPRPETSPMIGRELTEFFDGMSPAGRLVLDEGEGPSFLSNVNACYRRACWDEIRFADVAYAEDQVFGKAMLERGWRKVFQPRAGVLHAHDYPALGFMRRYFDEYRGLRETVGHVEPFAVRAVVGELRAQVAADRQWLRARGSSPREIARWTARSAVHHGGRKVFSSLGSRAARLPSPVQRTISLEGTAAAPVGAKAATPPATAPAQPGIFEPILQVARHGELPLADGPAAGPAMHVAVVIPFFRRGSGGHSTIFNLISRLEERGHDCSIWLHDPTGRHSHQGPAAVRNDIREFFRPPAAPVFKGFEHWHGADVVLATGWETVYPILRLPHCRARAYLVQDYEPEFFATSAESLWAEQTYEHGLHCIAASRWLAELVRERHGAVATHFDLAVDHSVYHPREVARREDTVMLYARDSTPRRAVALGILALEELYRRRPATRFVLFGCSDQLRAPFPYEHLGVVAPDRLAELYSEVTVGLSLSLTNYSLIPQEMLACGLPCVELTGRSVEHEFGRDGPVALAPPDPIAIAGAIERLLDDPAKRERRSRAGLQLVTRRTWERATEQLEVALRAAQAAACLRTTQAGAGRRLAPGAAASRGPRARGALEARTVPVDGPLHWDATDRLFGRLDDADVAAILDALDPAERTALLGWWEPARSELTLVAGVAKGIPSVLEKSGLNAAQPPETVHSMARGPSAAAGSLYDANLVAEGVRRAGGSMGNVRRGLDFGCSSGRMVRVQAAAWPEIEWHGVDPNTEAIEWAAAHLEGITFGVSPQEPPLTYDDASFDLVGAISIWSHFSEAAARRWLDEMARIIVPGGHLVLTTHGPQSVAFYAANGQRPPEQLAEIRQALYRDGYWYFPEFGEAGDWGVVSPQWGTAFQTPEWWARVALEDFVLGDYRVGRNSDNQDVYTLVRRGDRAHAGEAARAR
jgi:GT2 family glycosyltransferase/glycosyltransferase involved in cell wall biosynthesis